MYKIGVDIGGTKIKIGIFDADSKKLLRSEKAFIKDIPSIDDYIVNKVSALTADLGTDISFVESLGIGVPGTVSKDGKEIVMAPNLNIPKRGICEAIEEKLGIRAAFIQDSRAAAFGEYTVSSGNESVFVCVTLGTGIGTGIVINGKIFDGALGSAGELGHLPAVKGGRPCGCGKLGCLEKYAAGRGLDITAEELLGKGKSAPDLFAAAKMGDEAARLAITDAVSMLGRALTSIVNLLSPSAIHFSGGLSEVEDYLLPLIDYIKENCYSASGVPSLCKAKLGEDAPLFGAAFFI